MTWTKEEPFEERCSSCEEVKMVESDMHSTLDDPAFICRDCREGKEQMNEEYAEFLKNQELEKIRKNTARLSHKAACLKCGQTWSIPNKLNWSIRETTISLKQPIIDINNRFEHEECGGDVFIPDTHEVWKEKQEEYWRIFKEAREIWKSEVYITRDGKELARQIFGKTLWKIDEEHYTSGTYSLVWKGVTKESWEVWELKKNKNMEDK